MSSKVIGRRLFTDSVERDVYLDQDGRQHVIGHDGGPVYGVWILTEEVLEDAPVVVDASERRATS